MYIQSVRRSSENSDGNKITKRICGPILLEKEKTLELTLIKTNVY